jgi:hypothetical protein
VASSAPSCESDASSPEREIARAELRQVIGTLAEAGAWTVVERPAARGVLVPTYRCLVVRRTL